MEYIIILILLPFIIRILPIYLKYRNSNYKNASGIRFGTILFNQGSYGEFLTFTYLERLDGFYKLMTNLYLPKEDGSTTEIDLIMISEKGIFVIESKNYSGWIFGDEKNKNWTQTLQNKQKNTFLNPILQNKGHIKTLKPIVEIMNDNLYKSYIIFSERCTLKNVNLTSQSVKVLKRNELLKAIKEDIDQSPKLMSPEEVVLLYTKLKKYTCVDAKVKQAHIDNIKEVRKHKRGFYGEQEKKS